MHRIIDDQYVRATKLLKDNYAALRRVAEALVEREVLDSDQVATLLQGRPLAPVPTAPPGDASEDSEAVAEAPVVPPERRPDPPGFPVADPT